MRARVVYVHNVYAMLVYVFVCFCRGKKSLGHFLAIAMSSVPIFVMISILTAVLVHQCNGQDKYDAIVRSITVNYDPPSGPLFDFMVTEGGN